MYFAVDLGATSGRTIVGKLEDGKLVMRELTRFANNLIEVHGHFYWDIYALYNEVVRGLKEAAAQGLTISSIGIDTWGVDFVCVAADGSVSQPLSYRDPHTFRSMELYMRDVMPRSELYGISGTEIINFNSIFQLYAMKLAGNSAFAGAKKFLFTPDALTYMLTGEMVCEYTIASTSGLLDAHKRSFSPRLLESLGLSADRFGRIVYPGEVVGTLTPALQRATGLGAVPVVAVAGHDTASAIAAIPAKDENFAYLSSGTWSLMGLESKHPVIDDYSYRFNVTNEGGIDGTICLLKNGCGMWIYESCRREWRDAPASHGELIAAAMASEPFRSFINPDDAAFANPDSMLGAIADYCRRTSQPVPEGYGAICRCIFESMALRYRQLMEGLKPMSDHPIDVLHVIGGGSLNACLNQFTANSLGIDVLAGPQEATALGNILMQARAVGEVDGLWAMRAIVSRSVDVRRFQPADAEVWSEAYARFCAVTAKA